MLQEIFLKVLVFCVSFASKTKLRNTIQSIQSLAKTALLIGWQSLNSLVVVSGHCVRQEGWECTGVTSVNRSTVSSWTSQQQNVTTARWGHFLFCWERFVKNASSVQRLSKVNSLALKRKHNMLLLLSYNSLSTKMPVMPEYKDLLQTLKVLDVEEIKEN